MRPLDIWGDHSCSTQSEESVLDMERGICGHLNLSSSNLSTLQPIASGCQHSENNAAYFSWPTSRQLHGSAEGRANYFDNLQKGVLPGNLDRLPTGQQATTLLDLMTIRAFHSKILRRYSLGTAIGFRIRQGTLTDIPAILVFVARKVHRRWLSRMQCLPSALEGPGGIWCDVDVVEFSYYGAPAPTPKEQLYNELVDGLCGSDSCIGGGPRDLWNFGCHCEEPNRQWTVYLGAVKRATSFITDDLWYGIYAGTNPETFVRADGAFIPFSDDFDVSNVITSVKGVGEIGDVKAIDLQSPINSLVGKQVVKVGRSSGLTTGAIMAYALEYNDEKGICFFTDFLVVGENQHTFDLEGDSGSLIILTADDGGRPRPIGIIWGGTANRGRLKLKIGQGPENWTSGVDLGRLLDLLELDLIINSAELNEAVKKQRSMLEARPDSTADESSPTDGTLPMAKAEEIYEPLGLNIQQYPLDGASGSGVIPPPTNVEEHQFIPSFISMSPMHRSQEDKGSRSLSALRNSSNEDLCVSLQLWDREPKRQRCGSSVSGESPPK